MEGPIDQAGCYIQVAEDFVSRKVDIQGALRRCLTHLGLSKMQHQDDHQTTEHTLSRLFWKGSFGPIAASIKLCEHDPLAASISSKQLAVASFSLLLSSMGWHTITSSRLMPG